MCDVLFLLCVGSSSSLSTSTSTMLALLLLLLLLLSTKINETNARSNEIVTRKHWELIFFFFIHFCCVVVVVVVRKVAGCYFRFACNCNCSFSIAHFIHIRYGFPCQLCEYGVHCVCVIAPSVYVTILLLLLFCCRVSARFFPPILFLLEIEIFFRRVSRKYEYFNTKVCT